MARGDTLKPSPLESDLYGYTCLPALALPSLIPTVVVVVLEFCSQFDPVPLPLFEVNCAVIA